MVKSMRESFEEWAVSIGVSIEKQDVGGCWVYELNETDIAWESFQAACKMSSLDTALQNNIRGAFEKFAANYFDGRPLDCGVLANGQYRDYILDEHWDTWQAAFNQQQVVIDELEETLQCMVQGRDCK